MSPYVRKLQLEQEMDSDDFDMNLFDSYTKELNEIQVALTTNNNLLKAKREQKLQEEREEALKQELLSISDEEVEEMYKDFHKVNAGIIDANGRTFDQWFNQSVVLYTISLVGSTYEIKSQAKSDSGFIWDGFVSVAHARSKVLSLIKIKFRDHHQRSDREGCDFANIPSN